LIQQSSAGGERNGKSSLGVSTIEPAELGFLSLSLQEKISAAADRKRYNPLRLTTQQNVTKTMKNAQRKIIHRACKSQYTDPFMLRSDPTSAERDHEEAEEGASPKIKI